MMSKYLFMQRIKGDDVGMILAKLSRRSDVKRITLDFEKDWIVGLGTDSYAGRAKTLRAAVMMAVKNWSEA